MKNNKIRLIIVAIIVIVLIFVLVNIFRKTYKLELTNKDEITVVTIKNSNGTGKIEVKAEGMVKEAVNELTENKIKTKEKSKEVPSVEEYYIITFDNSEDTLYLYKKGNRCYIQKENDGVYKISNELYDKISKSLYI